ncbi:MAG: histidine triad nucleotide-binding protein, partial [Angelakisella sp.]
MDDCIFCKIAAGEIPAKKLYEDELCVAFYDLSPQAPVHFLVIPKEHIPSADYINEQNAAIVGHIYTVIAKLSAQLGLQKGYRVVTNCGEDGGQSVGHLHFHLLA